MRPVVAHIRQQFLPMSETFIYNLLRFAETTRPVVLCLERQNEKVFPWKEVVTLPERSPVLWQKGVSRFLRQMGGRPYFGSVTYNYIAALKQVAPQIVHAHFGPEGVQVMEAARSLRLPLVVGFHGYDFSILPRETYWADAYKELFKVASIVTVGSQFAVGKMEAIGCPKEKLRVIHSGIDLSAFCYRPRRPNAGNVTRFVGVGRLVEKKGTRYTLDALALLKRQHKNIAYTHIGSGELQEELLSLAKDLDIADICYFLGGQPSEQVRRTLAESDILIMPSVTGENGDTESQGIALQEAQAIGLPVIATRHNGFPEGLREGESGFLVPEKSAEALAERMDYLLQHPETWERMGQSGRAYVEQEYDIRRESAKLGAIYASLLPRL